MFANVMKMDQTRADKNLFTDNWGGRWKEEGPEMMWMDDVKNGLLWVKKEMEKKVKELTRKGIFLK
jgi:hypothetical protein